MRAKKPGARAGAKKKNLAPPPGCPMHVAPSKGDPRLFTKTDLTYNGYLKVGDLLALQAPQSKPAHHDEMLFIIIHQAYELWFKLILHEAESALLYMEKRQVLRAHHFVNRIVQIMKLLVQQIHILETMTPVEFLAFRDQLMPASGFQSSQFRELEFVAGLKDPKYLTYFRDHPEAGRSLKTRLEGPDLRSHYYEMIRALGYKIPKNASEGERQGKASVMNATLKGLLPIYQNPEKDLPLYLLSESLVEFDEHLALWREHHVRVVERVIGFKQGTGGSSGVGYLRSTTSKKCFPCLWEVRTHLVKTSDA
jgi:tryptophan 2,3-dioxygenase